jgi:hypothetical protein
MKPALPPLSSAQVQEDIGQRLLCGAAQTMAEAENQFLDAHLPEIARLAMDLTEEAFRRHEAVRLLLSHGSRPWEDGRL